MNRNIWSTGYIGTSYSFCISSGVAEVNIYGEVVGQRPVKLSGNSISDDDLKVHVYKNITYNNYQLYTVNNPAFNPDSILFKEEFNKVIKQAVLNMESVEKRSYNNSNWDNNENGILDLFVDQNGVPAERLEHARLLMGIENTYKDVSPCGSGLAKDQEPKTMILPGTIRRNWLIVEDVVAGESTIKLHSVKHFNDGDEIYIRTWRGGSPEFGDIVEIDMNDTTITLENGLTDNYPINSVVTDARAKVKAFTMESCSWVEDLENYRNVIHEFCHMKNVAPLSHAIESEDSTNLMYPLYGNYGKKLRCRSIYTDNLYNIGVKEMQWKQLHETYTY